MMFLRTTSLPDEHLLLNTVHLLREAFTPRVGETNSLTFTTLWANSADDLMICCCFYFSQKIV